MTNLERHTMSMESFRQSNHPHARRDFKSDHFKVKGMEIVSGEDIVGLLTPERQELANRIFGATDNMLFKYGFSTLGYSSAADINIYKQKKSDSSLEMRGFYIPPLGEIFINEDVFSNDESFSFTLCHEYVHANAKEVVTLGEYSSATRRTGLLMGLNNTRRTGYKGWLGQKIYARKRQHSFVESREIKMNLFNEALVDLVAESILQDESIPYVNQSNYRKASEFLLLTIEQLAKKTGMEKTDVFETFLNAEFGSAIPLIKLFEKTFGRGSFYKFADLGDKITTKIRGEYLRTKGNIKWKTFRLKEVNQFFEVLDIRTRKQLEELYKSSGETKTLLRK